MSYPPVPLPNGHNFTVTLHSKTYAAIDSATSSDHSGHIVFISGASKGVGRATAISFARAGAEGIVIGARSDLSSLETELQVAATAAGRKPPKVLAIKLDLLSHQSVKDAVEKVEETFGRLDILVNNAGYLAASQTIAESDLDEWWQTFEVNIRGVYMMTRGFLPMMLKSGMKTIVNVASTGANSLRPGASGYQTSKFALLRFTEFVMTEYADRGILAYCVHPGAVNTDMGKKLPEYLHKGGFHKYRGTELGDDPELAGDTMCFLTQERREWLAGRYINCTWDMPEFLDKQVDIVENDKLKERMLF
ncbi:oxidoreductase short chain dehydrogenase reductase family protein [Rutstroemia sp. NJR-2017a BBW]|nr:oxidoreductase short chain dehydrogenase reductase family protein [Rutstroemia sp. NJR-2017a BBW]